MCQNNQYMDKDEWTYYVGEGMRCKEESYQSTDDVTWSNKYN